MVFFPSISSIVYVIMYLYCLEKFCLGPSYGNSRVIKKPIGMHVWVYQTTDLDRVHIFLDG